MGVTFLDEENTAPAGVTFIDEPPSPANRKNSPAIADIMAKQAMYAADARRNPAVDAATNFLPSAGRIIKDVVGMVNPLRAKSGGTEFAPPLIAENVAKLAGGIMSYFDPMYEQYRPYADAMKKQIVDRYGSLEAAAHTIRTDPAGFVMDVSPLIATKGAKALQFGRLAAEGAGAGKTAEFLGKMGKIAGQAENVNLPNIVAAGAAKAIGGAGKVIKGASQPGAGSLDQAAIESAGRLGMTLPISAESTSPIVRDVFEYPAARGYMGSSIQKNIKEINAELPRLMQEMKASAQSAAVMGSPQLGAQKFASLLDKYEQTYRNMDKKLYKELGFNFDVPVPANNTLTILDDLLDTEKYTRGVGISIEAPLNALKGKITANVTRAKEAQARLAQAKGRYYSDPAEIAKLKGELVDVENTIKGGHITFNQAEALKKKLYSMIEYKYPKPSDTNNIALKKVARALKEDIDNGAEAYFEATGQPDRLQAIKDARQHHATGMSKLENSYIEGLRDLAQDKQWTAIADIVGNAAMAPENVSLAMELAGPKGKPIIQALVLDDLFNKSLAAARTSDVTGELVEAHLMPGRLGKILNENRSNIEQVFDPDQIQRLRDVANVSQAMGRTSKMLSSSPTGIVNFRNMLLAGVAGGASAASHGGMSPYTALMATVAGDAVMNAFTMSKFGRKWLTTGFDTPAKYGSALQQAGSAMLKFSKAHPVKNRYLAPAIQVKRSQEEQ